MPVELRKRKAPAPPPEPPAKRQSKVSKVSKVAKVAKVAAKVKDAVKPRGRPAKAAAAAEPAAEPAIATTNGSSAAGKPEVGDVISLVGFGGEIETQDGTKTTLKALVDESKAGVVLFTYPKASTPGCKCSTTRGSRRYCLVIIIFSSRSCASNVFNPQCAFRLNRLPGTRQACLFRDSYEPLTAGGLLIYGLSTDSPKANTTFKEKQKLPYPLLCDPGATLIGAIGLKKTPKGTTRGVFVVDKAGKVLAAQAGGPEATVSVVKKIVAELGDGDNDSDAKAVDAIPAPAPAPEPVETIADVPVVDPPAKENSVPPPATEEKVEEKADAPNGDSAIPEKPDTEMKDE